jgi:hypothetical protein
LRTFGADHFHAAAPHRKLRTFGADHFHAAAPYRKLRTLGIKVVLSIPIIACINSFFKYEMSLKGWYERLVLHPKWEHDKVLPCE